MRENELMNSIGNILGKVIKENGDKYGFALFVFQFERGDDHRLNYISNVKREDILAILKEFIAKNEGRFDEDFTKRKSQ